LLQVSVFLPAYNEEANIAKTIANVEKFLPEISDQYEIIIVNDGSKDNTSQVVKKLARNNLKLRMISHAVNKGYGAAIKSGLYACRYPWIVQMDSDGQFDFSEIKKFIPFTGKFDLVIGFRAKRTDSKYRRFMAGILKLADNILFGLSVNDVDCGFKLFKKEVVDRITKLKTESAITVTEFMVRAKNAGYKIKEISVNHYSRKEGEQTGGKPSIIIKAAWQGIWLWFLLLKEKIWK